MSLFKPGSQAIQLLNFRTNDDTRIPRSIGMLAQTHRMVIFSIIKVALTTALSIIKRYIKNYK